MLSIDVLDILTLIVHVTDVMTLFYSEYTQLSSREMTNFHYDPDDNEATSIHVEKYQLGRHNDITDMASTPVTTDCMVCMLPAYVN